ncbi:hypothetical protein OG339_47185 (plasmid) [Streptosporangium sp. NBC_01495]|uniref:hypothetical protein n=1 Tax=Streptosporangium sp. NBC_01495 TaxID=2903899 RepID=UPI002E347AB8|nr:hypothetical protein [Streptosporangium sp. NBC_01495]
MSTKTTVTRIPGQRRDAHQSSPDSAVARSAGYSSCLSNAAAAADRRAGGEQSGGGGCGEGRRLPVRSNDKTMVTFKFTVNRNHLPQRLTTSFPATGIYDSTA